MVRGMGVEVKAGNPLLNEYIFGATEMKDG
jgi:hypothetical protein